ncbi:MAG TPA: NUDIX domain-containing protein [Anaerolineaceae bacterium]|nr:NUDIX domain-containing protein [Anaerolineaceae bacterium]HUM49911.1 NUDIX domain-containing protein [Anaerolineaceae bacterium]
MKNYVRTSVKAVIIQNNQILLQIKCDALSQYAVLPGGGQHKGETLPEALRRECREEINTDVEVGDLLCVRDYISDHHEFAEANGHVHELELLFSCSLPEGYKPQAGEDPDPGQIGVNWVPLDQLEAVNLYPRVLRHYLLYLDDPQRAIYLGDVN